MVFPKIDGEKIATYIDAFVGQMLETNKMANEIVNAYMGTGGPLVSSAETSPGGDKIWVKFDKDIITVAPPAEIQCASCNLMIPASSSTCSHCSAPVPAGSAPQDPVLPDAAKGFFTIVVTRSAAVLTPAITATAIGIKKIPKKDPTKFTYEPAVVELVLSATILLGDTIKISYDPTAATAANDKIMDVDEKPVMKFDDFTVENKNEGIKVISAGTLKEKPKNIKIKLDKKPLAFPATLKNNFIVNDGAANATTSAKVMDAPDDDTIELIVTRTITAGAEVKLTFNKPTGPTVKDQFGTVLKLDNQVVKNNGPKPAAYKTSETVTGESKKIKVIFDKKLKTVPGSINTAFEVNDGANNAVTAAARLDDPNDDKIVLTATRAIVKGKTVTVKYTKPSANPIVDINDVIIASFPVQNVTNKGPKPAVISTGETVENEPKKIKVTFDKKLKTVPGSINTSFKVNDGADNPVTAAARLDDPNDDKVVLTVTRSIVGGTNVKVKYNKPNANPIVDSDDIEIDSVPDKKVTNKGPKPATISSAETDTDDFTKIKLKFNKKLDAVPNSIKTKFIVNDGASNRVENVSKLANPNDDTIELVVQRAILGGKSVNVKYTKPGTGFITDSDDIPIETIRNQKVANNNPKTATLKSGKTTPNGKTIEVTFSKAMSSTIPGSAKGQFVIRGKKGAADYSTTVKKITAKPEYETVLLLKLNTVVTNDVKNLKIHYNLPADPVTNGLKAGDGGILDGLPEAKAKKVKNNVT